MTNVIKQIVSGEGDGQTIKMIVRDNERGPQGAQGVPGAAATIKAGEAYAVPGGNPPAVINSGTSTNAVFDFYIPRTSAAWGDVTGNIDNQRDLKPYLDKAENSVQPEDINYTVVSDLEVDSNTSTSSINFDAAKVNLMSGTVSSKDIPLPVASSTEAGVMNSSTFDAVVDNSTKIRAILGGMVAVSGLPENPTQAELTTAWQTATGLSAPGNYSKILDVDNSKYWTYFTNTSLWYHGSADIDASVAPFTNLTDGTIKGSTNVGQIFAESDGTGSVNGWDALTSQVANNTNNMVTVGTILSQPSSIAYVDTANIVDDAVTVDKIGFTGLTAYASRAQSVTLTTSFTSYLSVDVSNIPTGATFFVIANVCASESTEKMDAIVALAEYNSIESPSFIQCTYYGRSVVVTGTFTKASGVNTLYIKARKDNPEGSMAVFRANCLCIVIG